MGWFGKWKKSDNNVHKGTDREDLLTLKKEIGHTYTQLCWCSSEEIAKIIGCMMSVHSKEYMQQILAIAKNQNNYKLAQVLQEQYTEYDNKQLEVETTKLQERFNNLHWKLYWWWYSGNVYNMERWFSDLEQQCKDLWMYGLAEKCHKVATDIQKRGKNILFDIRKVILDGWKKWWEE